MISKCSDLSHYVVQPLRLGPQTRPALTEIEEAGDLGERR
jgi:hypothetical protein